MRCPYCLSPIAEAPKPFTERMTRQQWSVYKTVLDSGPAGVPTKVLMEKLPEGRNPVTLRTCVFAINKIIHPMKLDGRGGRYHLERNEGE